jgi:hypothetical protein
MKVVHGLLIIGITALLVFALFSPGSQWPMVALGAITLCIAAWVIGDASATQATSTKLAIENDELKSNVGSDLRLILDALEELDKTMGIVDNDGSPAFIKAVPKELVMWRDTTDTSNRAQATAVQLIEWLKTLTKILTYRVNDIDNIQVKSRRAVENKNFYVTRDSLELATTLFQSKGNDLTATRETCKSVRKALTLRAFNGFPKLDPRELVRLLQGSTTPEVVREVIQAHAGNLGEKFSEEQTRILLTYIIKSK